MMAGNLRRSCPRGEASHFTPWLADNLDILADALGLAELTLVETESDVAGNRLDILATGTDEDGDERPVAIENQYGISDHKHLGQLVTYLAQPLPHIPDWKLTARRLAAIHVDGLAGAAAIATEQ